MKKLFFLILPVTFITLPTLAGIPAKVTDAFQARYAHATKVEWKHMMGKFEADFTLGQYQLEAAFNKHGQWLESEKFLGRGELPVTVMSNIQKSKYRRWKIKSTYVAYLPNERAEYHVIVTKGDFAIRNLKFDHDGQWMRG